MSRIREWMHGKGRWVVIAVMILLALWIIVDFYRTTHVQPEPSDKPVQQMAPVKDVSSEDTPDADTEEDTASSAKPEDTPDHRDGQTESQETVGGGTQNQDSPDTETTNEDTKDSGMTTTEEDVGTGSEACRTE